VVAVENFDLKLTYISNGTKTESEICWHNFENKIFDLLFWRCSVGYRWRIDLKYFFVSAFLF
jgi:hypothetical protein